MSEQSIFNADNAGQDATQNPATPQTPQLPPEVAELVGDGKKYKTTEDALKALPHAQTHIQKLEAENAALKEAQMKAKAVEDLLEEFRASNTQGSAPTGVTPPVVPSVDIVKTVDEVVAQRLAQQEAQRQAAMNTNSVVAAFSEKFGTEGEAEYIKLAQETGLSIASLNRLAATSPAAVLKLAGIAPNAQKETTPAKTGSSLNTEAFRNQNQGTQQVSARVQGNKTSDLVSAWRSAKPNV